MDDFPINSTTTSIIGVFSSLQNQLIKLILYGGAVLLIITSKVPSILSQNIQGQHQTNYVGKSADSGEVISGRSPALNEHEPSCEELRAMWRLIFFYLKSLGNLCCFNFIHGHRAERWASISCEKVL